MGEDFHQDFPCAHASYDLDSDSDEDLDDCEDEPPRIDKPLDKIVEYLHNLHLSIQENFKNLNNSGTGSALLPGFAPWIRAKDAGCDYVAKQAKHMLVDIQFDFADFILPDVFVWAPDQMMINRSYFKCPTCHFGDLQPDGCQFAPPRKVHDLENFVYLIARKYVCSKDRNHRFVGSSPDVLSKLPVEVYRQFPFMLSKKSAVSKGVARLISLLKTLGLSFKKLSFVLNALKTERFATKRVGYNGLKASRMISVKNFPHPGLVETKFAPWTVDYSDVHSGISPHYLRDVYLNLSDAERSYQDFFNQRLGATSRYLAADHTFQVN